MTPQTASSTQEVLEGLVERVTFHNGENGFCVLRIKARGHRDLPAGDRKVERFGWTFAPRDKVMQIENDYDKEVGQKKAVGIAVHNVSGRRRWSKLSEWLAPRKPATPLRWEADHGYA
jgi:hypothetical protein